jgi:hypothetical protein
MTIRTRRYYAKVGVVVLVLVVVAVLLPPQRVRERTSASGIPLRTITAPRSTPQRVRERTRTVIRWRPFLMSTKRSTLAWHILWLELAALLAGGGIAMLMPLLRSDSSSDGAADGVRGNEERGP